MPTCDNCGERQFECVDGLFYCQLCQTQSQDLREEEVEDEVHNVRLALHSTRVKVKKEKQDHGRPWNTHEAFTIILKQQVKALMALGASPKLEDIVFRLWTLYLSKIGVAFDTSQCTTYVRPKGRDLRPSTLADPEVPPLRLRRTCLKRGLTRHVQQGDTTPTLSNMSTTEDDESCEGDNSFEAPQEQTAPAEPTQVCEDEEDDGRFVMVQSQQPGYMSMQKTVCLCYLGLCHTNSVVLPTDLLRWIQSGRIPYGKSASDLLPGDMKFSTNDARTFCCQDLPSSDKMRSLTGSLAYFLGMKTFPKVSLELIASRFILELNLPGELHGLVRSLMKRHPIELQLPITIEQITCAPYAVLAMAYLVVLLKLIFGLDDHTEKELSNYARELSGIVTLAQPLFVWHDWACHMERRTAQLGYQKLPCNTRDVKDIIHVDQCLKMCGELSDLKGRRKIVKKKRSNTRSVTVCEALQEPFVQLLQRMKCHPTTAHENPPEPTASRSVYDNDPLQAMYDEDVSPRDEHAKSSRANDIKDFSVCTLRYVTEDVNFCDQLDSLGLSDSTIQSSCVDTDSDSSDSCLMDLAVDPHQPKRKRRKRAWEDTGSLRQGKRVVKAVLHQNVASPHAAKLTVSASQRSQVEGLLKKRILAYQNYTFYEDTHKSVDYDKMHKHKSYTWLLGQCSRHIDCNAAFLHEHVRQLEMFFIVDEDELCTRAKWQKSVFQRRYVQK